MTRAAFNRVLECSLEPVARFCAPPRLWMIDCVSREIRIHLQEHIRTLQPARIQFIEQLLSGSAKIVELTQRLQMRSALKQSNIYRFKAKHCDHIQRLAVSEQRKCEIGTREFQVHAFFPKKFHSAAAR